MLIVFYGADGSGKSSVINSIAGRNPNVQILHFRPNILGTLLTFYRKKNPSVTGGRPYSGYAHTTFFSVIKIFYSALEYVIWGAFNYFKIKSKKEYIIFDRYYLDLAIDQPRMMISGMLPLIHFLYFFVPKPSIQITLYGDPKLISERKHELTAEEVEVLNDKYKSIPGAYIIKTTGVPLEDTLKKVNTLVFGNDKST